MNEVKRMSGANVDFDRLVMRLLHREQYILFAGHCYYADGGAEDFRGFYISIEAAKQDFVARADEIRGDSYVDNWGQIVDRVTMQILLETRADHVEGDYDTMREPVWEIPDA